MYLFDMDGTLIDSNSVWKDVDREFLARRGLPYTKAYYEGVAHTIFPLAAKFTKEFCHLPESEEAQVALCFHPAGQGTERVKLELYGAAPDLAGLTLTAPALAEADRSDLLLLTALWEGGRLGENGVKIT